MELKRGEGQRKADLADLLMMTAMPGDEMTRLVPGLRLMWVTGMVVGLLSVTGCGADGTSGSSTGAVGGGSTGTPIGGTDGSSDPGKPPSSGKAVTLQWDAPTENVDGSALSDLKGYKVHYGQESNSYEDTIEIANPGLTTYVVDNLPSGTYYFAVTAYNSNGHESTLSGEVSTQVDGG